MPPCYQDAITQASTLIADVFLTEINSTLDLGTLLDKTMHDVVRELGRQALTRIDTALDAWLIHGHQGPGWTMKAHPTVTFTTLLGEVQVPSAYLWHPTQSPGIRPLKVWMGIEGNRCREAVQRALVDFGSERSFERAARQFREHYGWDVGRGTVRNQTERIAWEAEQYVTDRLHRASESTVSTSVGGEEGETIVTEVDGCEIRTGRFMTAQEAGDGQVPPSQMVRVEDWKEVRTGIVRPLDDVTRVYVCRMAGYPEICRQAFEAACACGLTPESQVIAPGDGGNGLKEELATHFVRFQYILDHRHLESHLHDTADALGLEPDERNAWVRRVMDKLWENDVQNVLHEFTDLYAQTANDRLRRLLKHLQRFEDAVEYGRFQKNGWPVGSGEVESAHRDIPQERLDIAGACWKPETVNPMLALRVIRANVWWDDFWKWRHEQHHAQKKPFFTMSKGN